MNCAAGPLLGYLSFTVELFFGEAPTYERVVMKRKEKLLAMFGAVLLAFSLAVPAAQAEDKASDTQVKRLVDKAFAGTITDAEKSVLNREHPEVAAVVPDQSSYERELVQRVPIMSGRTGFRPQGAETMASTKCYYFSGSNVLKSILGFTIYRFSHKAKACANGSKVTSHSSPTYTISQADMTVDHWSVVDRTVSGVGTSASKSRLQVKVVQCVVKYGCYANHYPTGTITAKKNNTANISTTSR